MGLTPLNLVFWAGLILATISFMALVPLVGWPAVLIIVAIWWPGFVLGLRGLRKNRRNDG